jgi:hypothetical protein
MSQDTDGDIDDIIITTIIVAIMEAVGDTAIDVAGGEDIGVKGIIF